FSLLLVYPIAERAENRWVKTYASGFYIVLLPSIVMLWLAIWKRIDQYGVTERRYFLAVLSIWLAAVAVYYVVRRSRDIRVIPWSLCLVGVITFLGPWGAYAVSEASQVNRLRAILERNEIYRGGDIATANRDLTFEDRREVSEILRYLVSTHGTSKVAPWFGGRLAEADTLGDGTEHSPRSEVDTRSELIAGLMGVPYVGRWQSDRPGRFDFTVQWDQTPIPIGGFANAVRIDALDRDSAQVDGLTVRYDSAAFAIRFLENGELVAEIPLQTVVDRAAESEREGAESRGLPPAVMRVDVEGARIRLAAYISRIAGDRSDDGLNLWDLDLQLYYTLR
ncbi:MAG: DUF4153 domain-containing protein, partial [Gemmatimonadota bacterium]|nr:DUF4153 domain-containing protein [Gemmatimonadota bacterium]